MSEKSLIFEYLKVKHNKKQDETKVFISRKEKIVGPYTQAFNGRFSSPTRNSMGLSWNRGDGMGVVVFVKGSRISVKPLTNNKEYISNSIFGQGSMVDRGAYCVYKGSGTTVNITGLSRYMLYYYVAYEYKNTPTGIVYNQTTSSTNPVSRYTLR